MSEAEVKCISNERIHPATRTDTTQRLNLTPWDLPYLSYSPIQKGVLFNSKPLHSTWLTDLKTSLSITLDHFYKLAGRLAIESNHEDETISIFVECNNQGADFFYATADITISEILSPLYVPRIVQGLFSFNDSFNYDESGTRPLLSVQVTELIDGVFLGITMNHMVADGISFWNFMNSWSEICKTGSFQIQKPPIFQFPNRTELPIRLPASIIQSSITPYSLPLLQEIVFHFTPHNILKLKQKANLEINNKNIKISSFQAVLAHLWIGITRARNLHEDKSVEFKMAMGNRGRLDPPLPNEYFGNCVGLGGATIKVGELMNCGIGFAASLLNKAVSLHTTAKICTVWENFPKAPVFLCVGRFPDNILVMGSSPRFNMYGNDFGWGCPVAVRSGRTNKNDGSMSAFPGAFAGSMDIVVCLSPDTMKRLGEDNNFLKFVDPKVGV